MSKTPPAPSDGVTAALVKLYGARFNTMKKFPWAWRGAGFQNQPKKEKKAREHIAEGHPVDGIYKRYLVVKTISYQHQTDSVVYDNFDVLEEVKDEIEAHLFQDEPSADYTYFAYGFDLDEGKELGYDVITEIRFHADEEVEAQEGTP